MAVLYKGVHFICPPIFFFFFSKWFSLYFCVPGCFITARLLLATIPSQTIKFSVVVQTVDKNS